MSLNKQRNEYTTKVEMEEFVIVISSPTEVRQKKSTISLD